MIEILPTNTCPADFADLTQRSDAFRAFAKNIHLDIADQKFVPVQSWPYHEGQSLEIKSMIERGERLPFTEDVNYEVHMMVTDPLTIGESIASLGCKRIIGHIETLQESGSVERAFSAWKSAGAQEVGIAVLLDTPLSAYEAHISSCDVILLMSIATLGKQGAAFDDRIFDKVSQVHTMYPDVVIAVDGGVAPSNIKQLVQSGATRFGVGSAITKAPDPALAYAQLLELATSV